MHSYAPAVNSGETQIAPIPGNSAAGPRINRKIINKFQVPGSHGKPCLHVQLKYLYVPQTLRHTNKFYFVPFFEAKNLYLLTSAFRSRSESVMPMSFAVLTTESWTACELPALREYRFQVGI